MDASWKAYGGNQTICMSTRGKLVPTLTFLVIGIAIATLLGWVLQLQAMTRLLPGLPAMNPLTASLFFLSACSLYLISIKRQGVPGIILCGLVIILSFMNLVWPLTGLSGAPDEVLFSHRLERDPSGIVTTKMALTTSINFVCIGCSIGLMGFQKVRFRKLSMFLSLPVLALSFSFIVGYLYYVRSFYSMLVSVPMAFHTSLSFILLAVAVLYTRPSVGFMEEFVSKMSGGRIARNVLPWVIALPFVIGILQLLGERLQIFRPETGEAISVICLIMFFLVILWKTARYLNEADKQNISMNSQLKVLNKELESFSYSVSHDLRAPIRSINGYTGWLKEDFGESLGEEGRKILQVIEENGNRIDRQIEALLEFSKLGKKELKLTQVDMNKLALDVVEAVNQGIEHNSRIAVMDLPPALGDHDLLFLVLQNLVLNAVKYSSKKEKPTVEIGCMKVQGRSSYYVRDNGAGFDMHYHDKLFGVFQRLHKKEEFEGTGAGLAIVNRIITKHGGKIWATSKLEEGATFYFYLHESEA